MNAQPDDYGYKVAYANSQFLTEQGFEALAHLPLIFDSRPAYARVPNRFLIDRALGYWDPRSRGAAHNPLPPSRQSMRNFAHWLSNALEWAELRGVDLMIADYSRVLVGRYQDEMLRGTWSAANAPLSPQTVNSRVQVALEYQMWASDKGLREPLIIPTVTRTYTAGSHANSRSHETKSVEARRGKVKVNKRTLLFPSMDAVHAWLKRVHERPVFGETEGLIAELILNTAIRREEAACWRVDTLPLDPKDWRIVNADQPEEYQCVLVTLKYGTKGKQYGIDEHGDKIGPEGTIHVPLWLARRIHDYRNKERLLALKPLLKKVRTKEARRLLQQVVHLFVNPETGKRYTGTRIYTLWTRGKEPAHWSPHLARDWWACRYLQERMKQHAELIQQVLKLPNPSSEHPMVLALRDTAQTVIDLEIRPQLRHSSTKTTEIYLSWLFNQVRMPLGFMHRWVEYDEYGEQK